MGTEHENADLTWYGTDINNFEFSVPTVSSGFLGATLPS